MGCCPEEGGGARRKKAYRRAGLDEELAHGGPVIHGVEGGDLVDAHGGHLEQAGDLIHDADGGEAVLALAEVEQRHDGGLLVLGRVALEDLLDDGLVLLAERERDVGVVVGRVPVLRAWPLPLAYSLAPAVFRGAANWPAGGAVLGGEGFSSG